MGPAEERESGTKPFYERGSFKAAVAVVGLLTGIWALLGAPKPWQVASDLAANPLPLRNTEIILDASESMGDSFGKATKLAVAAEAVGRYAAAGNQIGLALRRVGGSCDEESSPLVGFGADHSQEVREKAEEQQAAGKSNLTLAVRTAIGDFAGDSFHRPESENQIVIFAGSGDECGELAGREIRDELVNANVHAVFKVFALDASTQAIEKLDQMKQQLQGVAPVEVTNAETVRELEKAVEEERPRGHEETITPEGESTETTTTPEEGATGESGVEGEG